MSTKVIMKRSDDFSQWYLDVIDVAELAEHAEVKGTMIIKPYGYAIWENFQNILDAKIKETGHENAYFPLLIPESYLAKEKEHLEGFSPELAVVTHAGGKKLDEPYIIRPTSETIINAAFARWIHSWRDLPLLINQWANVVRWEMRPRLFLRTTEFLWQEGHTAHVSEKEAEKEALKILKMYKDFMEKYLAIPVITGEKSEAERFAGALRTYTVEALMQDGKALQMGTSHNLGQNFAKVFEINYTDEDNKQAYVWQTSWGVSTRLIGGLIMVHSDDKGLVLPPKIAPLQVIIVPIWGNNSREDAVTNIASRVLEKLEKSGVRVKMDDRDSETVGNKFYAWEKKGVPIRIELGKQEVADNTVILVRRDSGEKQTVSIDDVTDIIVETLNDIQSNLFVRAKKFQEEHSYFIYDYKKFQKQLERGGFIYSHWCGEPICEEEIKNETKATIRCIPMDAKYKKKGSCIKCGGASKQIVIFARAY